MSKSNVFGRLNAAFSATNKSANSIKPKPQKLQLMNDPSIITNPSDQPTKPKTMNQKITELLREKDPQMLLERFKYLSQYSSFRERCRDVYKLTINRFALAGQHSLIEQALESQKDYLFREGFACRIIYLYGKYGMFDHAYKVFDELPERKIKQGVKSLVALLGAAANSGKFDKAYELFRELPTKLSIEPDVDCYNTAMNALCYMGKFDEAVSLLDEMEAKGLKPNVVSFNTLLRACYEEAGFEEGEKLWERMIQSEIVPDVHSYNFKSQGLILNGRPGDAVELVKQLKSKGLKPNVDTFNALINGFVKDGNLDEAREWCSILVKRNYTPNKTTFSILVPFLCENNDLDFAFKVCNKMLAGRHCSVDEGILQNVVDGLARESKIEEAKIIVELARSNSYCNYNLVIPETPE